MSATADAVRPAGVQRLRSVVAVAGAGFGASAMAAALVLHRGPAAAMAGTVAFMVADGVLIAVGTLIIVRRGRNLVGWLCWLAGMLATLAFASGSYTEYGLSLPDRLPGVMVAGWLDLWLGSAWVSMLLLIPLVFPDGRLPSSRWRPVASLAIACLIGMTAVRAFKPTVYAGAPLSHNPLGVDGAEHLFAVLDQVSSAAIALPLLAGATALFVRFRRSRDIQRAQIKCLLYAMTLVALLFVQLAVAPAALSERMSDVVFGLGYGTLPIAIGVAVLRYRLYDIDHIIRRTIVYALVTAALTLMYTGGVLIAGGVISGGRRSDLVIAIWTLAAAALFRPLRRRMQDLVDRRFNRQRFDATTTVKAFRDTVREELDADALMRELLAVTRRAVQPTHLWLWRPMAGAPRINRSG